MGVADERALRGRRVVVVEDGPTLTHGGMPHGAGWLAARRAGAVVDPRPWVVGSLRETYRAFASIGPVLPALGYGESMIRELEQTLNAADAEVVLVGTPIDLGRFLHLTKPVQRARYELEEIRRPTLRDVLAELFGHQVDGSAIVREGGSNPPSP